MIYNHLEGYEKSLQLRIRYGNELELVCANSQCGFTIEKVNSMMNLYKQLQEKFPDQVLIKESEAHEDNSPYYEASFFCFSDEIDQYTKIISDMGIEIDIYHDHK